VVILVTVALAFQAIVAIQVPELAVIPGTPVFQDTPVIAVHLDIVVIQVPELAVIPDTVVPG